MKRDFLFFIFILSMLGCNLIYAEIINFDVVKKNTWLLCQWPDNIASRIKLAELHLQCHEDLTALYWIRQGRYCDPCNADLLLEEANIHFTMHRYALSAHVLQMVAGNSKQEKMKRNYEIEIASLSPRYFYGLNEIGISTYNAYVNDLRKIWDYSSVYYKRDLYAGTIAASVNYASRLGHNAKQYVLEFSPRFNRDLSFDLYGAYANEPAIFPDRVYGFEVFANNTKLFEISLGARYNQIAKTYFNRYTASLKIYRDKYMVSFRPYFFNPKDNNNSILFTGTFSKSFCTDDHYLRVTVGAGHSPDLADLLTVNFIVISNKFINLKYEFPIVNHQLLIDLGVGYQKWGYPSGLMRELYEGLIGIKYRF